MSRARLSAVSVTVDGRSATGGVSLPVAVPGADVLSVSGAWTSDADPVVVVVAAGDELSTGLGSWCFSFFMAVIDYRVVEDCRAKLHHPSQ